MKTRVAGGAGQACISLHAVRILGPHVTFPLQGPAVLLRTTHAEVPAVATAERKEVFGLFHNTCLKCNRFGNNKMSKTYNGED